MRRRVVTLIVLTLMLLPAIPSTADANPVADCNTQKAVFVCASRTECVDSVMGPLSGACLTVTISSGLNFATNVISGPNVGLRPVHCTATTHYRQYFGTLIIDTPLPPPSGNVGVSCYVPPNGIPSTGGGVTAAAAVALISTNQRAVCADGTVVWPAAIYSPSQRIQGVCLTF